MGSFSIISKIANVLPQGNSIFVETGTYLGDGVKQAIKQGYSVVHSTEIDPKLYIKASHQFAHCSNIYIHHGDSSQLLSSLIDFINSQDNTTPITFWLDAHFPGSDLGEIDYIQGAILNKEDTWMPLKKELEVIFSKRLPIDNIIIDDLRCFSDRFKTQGNSFIDHLKAIGQNIPPNITRSDLVKISDIEIENMAGPKRRVDYYMQNEAHAI